ncbi:S-type anion channel SLAH2 [Aegilops tauschii subsp. strangulata]|uniref:S-type anion channel SLAH3 n=2 Tax=Aegilops tauschii subsp. strangulata TaxID=200361 RepID=A0A453EHI7_AEGTS|nr:S-type anion channel SLAH2 [Aegilops tauschii subsp. strangulata]XP_040259586.1 S-type anion channel SLAH2 [Aegilops tauschii subsp. strangulata]XP_045090649.1 S-type anion channel SLAH2 [Aegilops tauschii subsp. strangulata]
METGESARQGAAGARVPASRFAEEQAFRERHGDGDPMMASPGQDSPFNTSALFAAGHPVSVSLPASPSRFDVARTEAEFPPRHPAAIVPDASRMLSLPPRPSPMVSVVFEHLEEVMFRSQPIPAAASELPDAQDSQSQVLHDGSMSGARMGRSKARRDTSYDPFKTWSGKLEKQLTTHLRVVRQPPPQEAEPEEDDEDAATSGRPYSMPRVHRFFAALEGPELDKLRSSEELVLPSDKKWPFLLRFPVSAFGMCLGMSSQAILWKNIAISASTRFLHITLRTNLVLWCVSVALMCFVSALYACKVIFYFEAVRREYYHPIRVNFFFAPWIACLFLAIGVPEMVVASLPHWLWYVLMAPIVCLEIKIYGQWISGGQRRLSRVANPSNHLSIVGNFVGALLGAIMGLREGPIFFFAVGLAHYIVLFVTLYQRLPTSETLPRDLHPVFFLFVAAPSVACLAWARITGEFGYGSRIAYFIAMFLYTSLAVRINMFRGFRFSLAWWAYTFPMTSAAIASIRYSSEVKNAFTQAMCIVLSVVATLTVTALLLTTLLHATVHHDLFPNDISIAISERRPKNSPIAELNELHANSKDADAACRDLEAAYRP